MNYPAYKTEGVNRTQIMRFHPFVFIGKDPCKGWRGVPAGLDEAIPLNKIKYNEQRDEETGFGHIGPLGGVYENHYRYDPLHRLTRAGGSNQYRFEQAFELSRAGRPLSMSTNGKVKHYAYGEHTPPHAPQRIMVEDGYRRTLHDLRWDPAGNLGQVSTLAHDMGDIQSRFLFWTEDNRLHTVVDDRYHRYYAYDHAGERAMKVTGHSHQLDVNADLMHTAAGLDEFTLYPSPYLVFTNRGYTKHYYAGSERLAARIGSGFDRAILREQTGIAMTATHLFKQSQHHSNERHLNAPPAHTIRRDHLSENIYRAITKEFEAPMHLVTDAVIKSNNLISTAQNIVAGNAEPEVYFYHSDHLGSASWITDSAGVPMQHLQYLPYGEPFVNQRAAGSTYSERFRFTGKERDEETGYGYFGARYMDHELMTMWLSVDPMADKYPSISPYAYCAWNPVKLVDPDGREIDISALYDKNGKCKYKFIENALKAFAKTKLGYKELSKYAKAGQDILGVKFDKDGEYHSKGMDLSFGGEVASLQNSGDTERKKVNGRLNITINLSNVTDIKSIFEIICHETFIHARQAAADFKDNGELDHSYLNPYLKKYVKEAGGTAGAYINAEHCHFAWYDKSSQHDFIETMKTQYPKASNREIVDIINKGFGRTGIKIKQ